MSTTKLPKILIFCVSTNRLRVGSRISLPVHPRLYAQTGLLVQKMGFTPFCRHRGAVSNASALLFVNINA
jgi:hypothetical protein